jgi:CHAT domain-containing protein
MEQLAAHPLPGLVVLNGCWSGAAAGGYGADPLSLALGAVLGGADTAVAGIGAIGSTASALVCEVALGLLGDGLPVCSAIRQAQRSVRDTHPGLGPFEWAGLCAIGVDGVAHARQ